MGLQVIHEAVAQILGSRTQGGNLLERRLGQGGRASPLAAKELTYATRRLGERG